MAFCLCINSVQGHRIWDLDGYHFVFLSYYKCLDKDGRKLIEVQAVGRFFFFCSCYSSEYMMQVGDFGLSRLKHNTFLSSKSTAGTVSLLL